MANTPENVIKDLKNKKYAPVYFLQGDEPYYIDVIANWIEKHCLTESEKSFNQNILYGKDVNVPTILQRCKQFPMMSDKLVVIIKEAQELSDLGKENADNLLLAYLQNPLPSTVLVFCYKYKTLDARKTLAKNIDKFAVLVNSKKLYDNQLSDWVTAYFQQKGYKITPKAALMLSEFIGNNLSRLTNESDKLLINLKENTPVDENLVEKYVGISKEFNVFELQKALVKKDVLKANQIINYFESNPKANPIIPIISILFGFFTKILLTHAQEDKSESSLARALQVNPFFVKDYLFGAKSYSADKVISVIRDLRKADLMSKGVDAAGIGEGQILKELIFKILH
jgi:DNA polymerase-3 subunit delta